MADQRSEQRPKQRGTICLLSRGNYYHKEPITLDLITLDLITRKENRVYRVNKNVLRDVFGGVHEYAMELGSTQGWIVIYNGERRPLKLFNPLTRDHIQLPPLYPKVYRLFLSSDPCRSKDYTVVVVFRNPTLHGGDRMSFYKPRHDHSTWTSSTVVFEEHYDDFICHNDKIFGLSQRRQQLHVWDFSSVPTKLPIPRKVVDVESFEWHSVDIGGSGSVYLVESLGHVLMVQRIIRWSTYSIKTIAFTVFKLDYSEKRWMRIQTLPAGRAILIKQSGGSNICVSIQDFPELEENSIYFQEDYCLRVYNLREKKVRLLEYTKWDPKRCQGPILVVRRPW